MRLYFEEMVENKDLQIIIYDGYCNLCSRTVRFIRKRDKNNRFTFLPFQSDESNWIREKYSLNKIVDETVILIDKNKIFLRSDAALKILKSLSFPWNLFWIFKIIPRFIRDSVYIWIARNRFLWFGKRETCFFPENDK